ncbi:transglycosylase SLT domain-containing protein [Pinirhizobacter sp.]|jgi:membrane-bound lytic murein transglycosylase D|uniref:transglycosylase SLT domain-containing protein n=1 Tax=Pinirhizobacter sp. TaxID=2950432 RepID=UPI002F41F7D0
MNHPLRTALAATLAAALAACSTTAPVMPNAPPITTTPTTQPAPPMMPTPAPVTPVVTDFWDEMRASFQMDGCDSDDGVARWARIFTRRPDQFEEHLAAVLPVVEYAQESAQAHGVAGEFALLPWIESSFKPVKGKKGRPAGMWQIVPSTARTLGLPSRKGYDARLDTAASTAAVMKMLAGYHDELHDWRLVAMAFNAGEFSVRKAVDKYGVPPAQPAVPKMPMKAVTREHLTKLLAIACVVRQPERFHVRLPPVDAKRSLEKVTVSGAKTVGQVAELSSMPVERMLALNPAHTSANAQANTTLLMPSAAAEAYREAAASGRQPSPATIAPPVDDAEAQGKGNAKPRSVKVANGQSLWTVARANKVTVKQLMSWNRLKSDKVKPGQLLRLSP